MPHRLATASPSVGGLEACATALNVEPYRPHAERLRVRQTRYLPDPAQTVLRNYPASDRFLVGVSGGRDSVALLDWLTRNGYQNLIVCHLNHQLRGRSSNADARFVEKLAAKLGLDVTVGSTEVRRLATKRKISIESAARSARYEFFAQVAGRRRCHKLILAHHGDDLVETFLINLFRGAGAPGLGSIRDLSWHRLNKTGLQVIRPFLRVWRNDIDRYIRQHRLSFREDASNKDLHPLRNRIRHRVLPYLEKNIGRQIRQNLWRTAMILAEEEKIFDQLMPEFVSQSAELPLRPLREMAVALQRRTLHKWLRAGDVAEVGFDVVERVRALLDITNGSARTNLARNRHVHRRAGKLFLE